MAVLHRDQIRAARAYKQVTALGPDKLTDYAIAVQTFAGTVRRSGLAVAVATLDRLGANDLKLHLCASDIPGFPGQPTALSTTVFGLDAAAYMIATRETIAVATWLKRAAEARDLRAPREEKKS